MSVEIIQAGTDALVRYSEIPISFQVETIFRTETIESWLGGIELHEEKVTNPYIKDYDAFRGEGPTRWLKRFDMSNWGIFMAYEEGRHAGGTIVAPGAYIGDLDKEFAQLFDIRVHPEVRHQGIGTRLFQTTADWVRSLGCKYLKIETQNTNVPACRFYARQGCELGNIDRFAYSDYPEMAHEIRLVWYLEL